MRIFEPRMDEKIERARDLAGEMKGALERGEFHLAVQPIFDLAGERITAGEVLLRWTNRRHGDVSPVEFIPIAEDSGLIVAIGGWVIREACRIGRDWGDITIAVNLSPIQLRSAELPAVILGALAASGLPPRTAGAGSDRDGPAQRHRCLVGGARCDQPAEGAHHTGRFRHGLFVAQLPDPLPFQTLKIDRSFITDLERNPASVAIVQTVIELARKLGMRTTAEGVETQAQLDQLRRTRCDSVQGFPARPSAARRRVRRAVQRNGQAAPSKLLIVAGRTPKRPPGR